MLRTKCYAVYAVSQCIISDGELFSLSIYLSPSLSVCIALLMTLILSNSVALFVFLANRSSLPCYFFHHYNIISHRSFPLLPISPSLSSLFSLPLPPQHSIHFSKAQYKRFLFDLPKPMHKFLKRLINFHMFAMRNISIDQIQQKCIRCLCVFYNAHLNGICLVFIFLFSVSIQHTRPFFQCNNAVITTSKAYSNEKFALQACCSCSKKSLQFSYL